MPAAIIPMHALRARVVNRIPVERHLGDRARQAAAYVESRGVRRIDTEVQSTVQSTTDVATVVEFLTESAFVLGYHHHYSRSLGDNTARPYL